MEEHESTMNKALASMPADVAAGLIAAQARVQRVAKDSENKFAHYNYASAEDMIDEARGCLNPAGLGLVTWWDFVRGEGGREKKTDGGTIVVGPIGRVVVQYTVFAVSGASIAFVTSTPVLPEKGRPEDKAELSALTANLSYSLRGLLLIPRGDAPGDAVDERNDSGYQPRHLPSQAREAQARGAEDRRPPPNRAASTDIPFADPGDPDSGAPPVADPWGSAMKDALASILAAGTVADVLAPLDACAKLAGFPAEYVNAIRKGAVRRIIAIASARGELARANEINRAIVDASDEWHEETVALYKSKRAEIEANKPDQGRA